MTNVERMIQTLKASAQNSSTSTQADTEIGEVLIGDRLLNDYVDLDTEGTPSATDYIFGVTEYTDGTKPTAKKFTPTELVEAVDADVAQIKSDIEAMKTSVEGTKQEIEESATEISSAITTGISSIESAADTGVGEIGTAKESALDAIGESNTEGARGDAITAINAALSEVNTLKTAAESAKTAAESARDQAQEILEDVQAATNISDASETTKGIVELMTYDEAMAILNAADEDEGGTV